MKKIRGGAKEKIVKKTSLLGTRAVASGGGARAYDFVQSYHARSAWYIICFENRCELGTIKTPKITDISSVIYGTFV
ncbi:hypothetical protein COS66_02510 [Candidatus Berkelbacteria bacterium CG06_land_8_20_14_3_00_43_10]|nr:MAG: hypothetical protein COS66_02510 [Candidatus Berkelbacteria bacterium CG06_land_8_20_14_3_00_43_10]